MNRITYLFALLFFGLWCNGEARIFTSPYSENLEKKIKVTNPEITFSNHFKIELVNKYFLETAELEDCVIPQGISPNNDGLNDKFDLSCFNVTKLEIFNRNGTLVYSKENYTDEWFGQTNKGDNLPVGTYFYAMIYEEEGVLKKHSAWVYISR